MKEFKIEKIKREAYFIREFFDVIKPVFRTKEFEDFMSMFPFNIFFRCECNSCYGLNNEINILDIPEYKREKRGYTKIIRTEPLILASYNQSFRYSYYSYLETHKKLIEINLIRAIYFSDVLVFLVYMSSENKLRDLKRIVEIPLFFEKYINFLNLSTEERYGLFLCIDFLHKEIRLFREPDYRAHDDFNKIEAKMNFVYTLCKDDYLSDYLGLEEKNPDPKIVESLFKDLESIIDVCYEYITKHAPEIIKLIEKFLKQKTKENQKLKNSIKNIKKHI